MSVYKRYKGDRITTSHPKYKEAKWCVEFYIDGKTHKKAVPNASTKSEAENYERELRRSISGGNHEVFVDKTIFKDFIETVYLPSAKNNNPSYKVKLSECSTLNRFFGDYRLKAITPALIENFKTKRSKESVRCQKCKFGKPHECESRPVATSTVNRELTTLSAILTLATVNRRISENPMRFVKKFQEPDSRTRYLFPEEKQRLFKEIANNEQLFNLVSIAVLTGWRKGQILGLRKTSLDSRTQCVKLIRSKGSKVQFIPVSSTVWKLLNSLADRTDDFLFTNSVTGKQLLDFDKSWHSVCKAANIEGLHYHDLRRTFAIEMMDVKAGDFMIQTALGHADSKITKVYAQVQNQPLRDSLERLANNDFFYDSTIIQPSTDFPS